MSVRATLTLCLAACLLLLAACGGTSRRSVHTVEGRQSAPSLPSTTARVGPGIAAVAAGAAGVWAVTRNDSSLHRLDPATGRPTGSAIRLASAPQALALSAHTVWVLLADGHVVSVDPASRAQRTLPGAAVPGPGGLAVGAGAVWVSETAAAAVRRFDVRTGAASSVPVGSRPTDVVVADGSVWVANTDAATVTRIDAKTGKVDGGPIRVARSQILALTAGQGAVWAAGTDVSRADSLFVTAIDAKGGTLSDTRTRVAGGIPIRLAAGAGHVWSTDVGNILPGAPTRAAGVQRIDPGSDARAGAPIHVGPQPVSIAIGAGATWVADAGDGTVTRIAAR